MNAIVEPETKPQADRNADPASTAQRVEISRPLVLAACGLRKAFGGQVVLDGVNLELREGEVILLRGDNGSGKTTLINVLTGHLEPDAGTIHYLADGSPREFRFPRRWWQELNPFDHFTPESTAREGIGRMWQDVRLFNSQTLRDNIAVAEPGHRGENPIRAIFTPGRCREQEVEVARRADEMLVRLGLAGRESSSGDKISLGQSKRVAIARAVAAGARMLFLDEPLAGLDRQGIRDVLSLLESIARDHAVTLVIVEHVCNHAYLHGLVTTDWLLENGRIQDLKLKPQSARPSLISSSRSQWFSILAGDDAESLDEPVQRGALLTRIRRPDRWNPDSNSVLEIRDLVVKRGSRTVIGLDEHGNPSGFGFTLKEGEIAILQAPNGWGKSTLFDGICGNVPTIGGSIVLNGTPVESSPPWARARAGLSASPSAATLFPSLKVSEVARLATHSCSRASDAVPFAHRTISSLSGGEKQRTLLRMVLPDSPNPHLALLDEPFAMLDDNATQQVVEALAATHPRHAILLLLPANHSF
jgi:branched-chain amino acid transport system ATP-binding protein